MMKKRNLMMLLMIGLSATTVFTGCNKDDEDTPDPKPTISVSSPADNSAVTSGDSVDLVFTASSNNELKQVTVKRKVSGGSEVTVFDETVPNNTNSYNYDSTFAAGPVGTETYTITVTDKKDLTETKTITITVESDIKSFTATILGNQHSSTGSFYNVIDNIVMNQANAKANAATVDFVYYHGATNGSTIAAPDDAPAGTIYNNSSTGLQTWSVNNSTRFKPTTMTAAQFDNVSTKAELAAQASGSSLSAATALAVGDVFAFVTDASHGGKSGLAKVTAITGDNNTAGTITFDVKVGK